MTAAFVCSFGLVATRVPAARVALVAVAVWFLTNRPATAVIGGTLVGAWLVQQWLRRRSRAHRTAQSDLATLAELTAVGLTGGMGVQAALSLAVETLGGRLGAEASAVLRRMRVDGSAAAAGAGGVGRDLYRTIGRAGATGAPLLEPITRLADDLRAAVHAARLEHARRLPVAMLFPLALLILPGFLLLTVAPALLEGLGRLEL